MNPLPVTFDDVAAAADRIAGHTHRTPVFTSATVDRMTGLEAFFKAENLQKVGAFKARGAVNAVLSLPDHDAARGVVTHSSGNHGQALAYAASIRSIPCWVVMPHDAPRVKSEAVRSYGAQIVYCEQTERESTAERVRGDHGATLVHPFDDPLVIAGQGTAALELFDDIGDLDAVIAPIGGGGLLSGTAVVAAHLAPATAVIGAEPEEVDDAFRSLATGIRQPRVEHPNTIADGLLTGIGAYPFAILRALGAAVVTVSERQIVEAAEFFLTRMKLVVEPSAATALAALRLLADGYRGRRVGVIISGGNTDFTWLPRRAS